MPLFIQTLIHILKEIKEPKCLWQDSFPLFPSRASDQECDTVLGRDKGDSKQRITAESSRTAQPFLDESMCLHHYF